jgi:thiamine-monophosphate kinase
VIDGTVLTIDMLHERADFPPGISRYTAGWHAAGISLSDVAAMGARADATVAAYGAPSFDDEALAAFVEGAQDVTTAVGGTYVGGDLDHHQEFTVATAAVGSTDAPVFRDGATPGEVVCVTGELGRSAAGVRALEAGAVATGNECFQFTPRIAAGRALSGSATAMMDVSDGLARSLHQLAAASDVGFAIEGDAVPVVDSLEPYLGVGSSLLETALTYGGDFELVCTLPEAAVAAVRGELAVPLSVVGRVVAADAGVTLDGEPLANEGYTHAGD